MTTMVLHPQKKTAKQNPLMELGWAKSTPAPGQGPWVGPRSYGCIFLHIPNVFPERHSLRHHFCLNPHSLPTRAWQARQPQETHSATGGSFSSTTGSKQPAPSSSSLEPNLRLGTHGWLQSFLSKVAPSLEREGACMSPIGRWAQSPQRISNAPLLYPPTHLSSARSGKTATVPSGVLLKKKSSFNQRPYNNSSCASPSGTGEDSRGSLCGGTAPFRNGASAPSTLNLGWA